VDLTARHAWLIQQRELLRARLEGDPEWYDPKIAGWWLWGIANWIGGGWCTGKGPWSRQEVAPGDWRLVRGGEDDGRITRRRLMLGSAGYSLTTKTPAGLVEWFRALSARLRRVRVCSGDWSRVVTPSALAPSVGGVRGIFLDPPYGTEDRDECYAHDSFDVAANVRAWCVENGSDPQKRIAICGYSGEGHEALTALGWTEYAWSAHGGMSADKGNGSGGNNDRERIWFSPACLSSKQRELF
jgi:DNA adenine methylase